MKKFAETEWVRARQALSSANKLVADDPDSAASRAYYAAFHALRALFALKEKTFTKHSAIRSALHKDLIKAGKLDQELGKNYDYLMDLREAGDYGGVRLLTVEAATLAVRKASEFLDAIKILYNKAKAGLWLV
jgi:uncharacterized protein (UPF0332 family)